MKYSNFKTTEHGCKMQAHSKILDFIFKIIGKHIRKKMIKHNLITKHDKCKIKTNYGLEFIIEQGEKEC